METSRGAKKVGMSERKLRDIETRNLLIERYQLLEIAEKLGTDVAAIIKPAQAASLEERVAHAVDGKIQLRQAENPSALLALMKGVTSLQYQVLVQFKSEQIPL